MGHVHTLKTVQIKSLDKNNLSSPMDYRQPLDFIKMQTFVRSLSMIGQVIYFKQKRNITIPAGKLLVAAIMVLVAFQKQQVMNSLMMITKAQHLLVQGTIYQVMLLLMQTLSADQVLTAVGVLLLDLKRTP